MLRSSSDTVPTLTLSSKYMATDAATIGRKSSVSKSFSLPRGGYYTRAGALVDEIGTVS